MANAFAAALKWKLSFLSVVTKNLEQSIAEYTKEEDNAPDPQDRRTAKLIRLDEEALLKKYKHEEKVLGDPNVADGNKTALLCENLKYRIERMEAVLHILTTEARLDYEREIAEVKAWVAALNCGAGGGQKPADAPEQAPH